MGFEPTQGDPSGLAVHRLNRSATLSTRGGILAWGAQCSALHFISWLGSRPNTEEAKQSKQQQGGRLLKRDDCATKSGYTETLGQRALLPLEKVVRESAGAVDRDIGKDG